jgi:tripartite-type tricarboxylate transporter receptor subunit TctC
MAIRSLTRRTFLQSAAGLGVAALLPQTGWAQAYPNRPIKIIVGFAPGGLTDSLPRLLSGPMAERLGQPVVVESKLGAAGNIATTFVAQSPPDGYTLLASSVGQIVVSPHTSSMPVDPMKDLVHISMMGEGDQILNINAAVPAKNLAEFIALLKKNPGTMFYGDAGAGGSMHVYIEYFKMLAGVDMQSVHYKGAGQLMPDFLANRVQLSLNAFPVIEGYIAEGKLRPILIVGKEREPKLPGVPTAAEVGLKPLEAASNWFGLHAPKGHARARRAKDPDRVGRLAEDGRRQERTRADGVATGRRHVPCLHRAHRRGLRDVRQGHQDREHQGGMSTRQRNAPP